MDVSEIIRIVMITGLLLIALPFPVLLAAAAVTFAFAGFIVIETLLGFPTERGSGPKGRPRAGSSHGGSTSRFG